MKKILVLLCLFSFGILQAFAELPAENVDKVLLNRIQSNMKQRGIDVGITVTRLSKVKDTNFYFYKITFKEKSNDQEFEQYIFFDGNYTTGDFTDANSQSLSKNLIFDLVTTTIDLKGVTLAAGNKNSKNVIIEITDFECPFCLNANQYIEKELKSKKDYALYYVHMPLPNHDKAEIYAKIYEAAMLQNKNLAGELFKNSRSLAPKSDDEVVQYYSKYVKNKSKFIVDVHSKQVEDKLAISQAIVNKTNVRATPNIFINGKRIEGFDRQLIDKALKNIK